MSTNVQYKCVSDIYPLQIHKDYFNIGSRIYFIYFLGLCPQTHEDMSDRWLISVFFLFVWECRHHKDSNTVNKMTCCK